MVVSMPNAETQLQPIRRPKTRRNKAAIGLAIALFALAFGWQEREPVLQRIGSWWVVSDELAPADAIVVLGGEVNVRPFAAAELYRGGYASKILVSNVKFGRGERLDFLPSHTQLNLNVLLKMNVPASAVGTFGDDLSNTHEEAEAIRAWALKSKAKRVIIPTDVFATRRTRWIFDRELSPIGVDVIVYPFPASNYKLADWWRHRQGLVDFKNEVLKYLYYRARY
jgi:uncharacterized SAM-binding protein YcdF (DUF218 family)